MAVEGPGKLKCLSLEAATRPAWEGYARGKREAWLPHLADWSLRVVPALGHECRSFMVVDEQGEVRGLLPLGLRRSRLFGDSLVSVPGASWAGPLAQDEVVLEAMMQEVIRQACECRVGFVEIRDGERLPEPFGVTSAYLRFPIHLESGSGLPVPDERTRRRLKKAHKAGVRPVLTNPDCGELHEIYSTAMARLGSPALGREFFRALASSFGDELRVVLVEAGGVAVAADLVGFWNGLGCSLFAGATDAGRSAHADLIAIEAGLRAAADRGCHTFDLGRSPASSGGQTFKMHWNPRSVPLGYQYLRSGCGDPPDLNPDRMLWRAARTVWKVMPSWLQARLGPAVARQLL
ncbi:MAG: GNAT family N-acetyltransferase [Candidatus Wallbacteria bacterium]|nr:GNAT family N-acetyltransferase [Candidatus Wallbacteria bacterium]